MEWGQPQNFIWLWAVPAAAAVFFLGSVRKKRQMSRFGEVSLVERLLSSLDPGRRTAKRALFAISLALVVLALCQPHFRKKETMVARRGVDVIIAMDVSRSMTARDIAPTRLDKAKLELLGLIDQLREDRIGIVAFAGEAFIQCPLTLDKSAVKLFLSTAGPNLIPTPGTAIAGAIQAATQAFSQNEKDYKALVLLTDGEDHAGDPLAAAKRAKDAGVRIFTIGIGTPDGSTVPGESAQEGFKRDSQGRVVLSRLNESLLRQIAASTGGAYYRSSKNEGEIDSIAGEIKGMSQKGLKSERLIEYEENYQGFLTVALMLLFVEMWLSERKKE